MTQTSFLFSLIPTDSDRDGCGSDLHGLNPRQEVPGTSTVSTGSSGFGVGGTRRRTTSEVSPGPLPLSNLYAGDGSRQMWTDPSVSLLCPLFLNFQAGVSFSNLLHG